MLFFLHNQSIGVDEKQNHSYSEFPVTDNLNEMLQLLVAPSKTSAVFYRGFYVLLPELMYALIGTFGAKLSSDSASAAVVSSSLGSTSAVLNQLLLLMFLLLRNLILLVLLLLVHANCACMRVPIGF